MRHLGRTIQKYKRMMKSQLIIAVFLLTGCYESTQESSDWVNSFKPKEYTQKEKGFISKLESKGFFNVKINNPHIGIVASGLSSYELIMYSSNCCYDYRMSDSLHNLSGNIAKELYSKVIEDSILYDIGRMRMHIYIQSKKSDTLYFDFRKTFEKKNLETETGLRVIKNGSNSYKRVGVKSSDD
jgi:hypothetical protein